MFNNQRPVQSYAPPKLITAYYLGVFGGEDRPLTIRLRGGRLVHTPPIGRAFSERFTEDQFRDLQIQCGFHDAKGVFVTAVTKNKSIADEVLHGKRPKAVDTSAKASLTDAELLAELKARGLMPEAPVVTEVSVVAEVSVEAEMPVEEEAPKRAPKKGN